MQKSLELVHHSAISCRRLSSTRANQITSVRLVLMPTGCRRDADADADGGATRSSRTLLWFQIVEDAKDSWFSVE